MRRIEIAPSFDREADDIGVHIQDQFGTAAREQFVADLAHMCTLLAFFPTIGKTRHGYDTKLHGFAFDHNWIYFDFDDDEVHFLHITNFRRDKGTVADH